MGLKLSKKLAIFLLAMGLMATSWGAFAQSGDTDWNRWSVHNNESPIKLDHAMLEAIYGYSIVTFEKSQKRVSSTRPRPGTGSRIGGGSNRPARQKRLNEIPYKALKESMTFRLVLDDYLGFMQDVPVSLLNEDEQLAYWLNFHNAGLLSMILSEYPARKMGKFMEPGSTQQGFYQEQKYMVEGIRLSLEDIRDRIILANWADAMVVYGIFTGSQSGPNLMVSAFTGINLDRLLERNAKNLINSKRGFTAGGCTLKYNLMYEWYSDLFGGEQGILDHIKKYATGDYAERINGADRYKTIKYSWKLNEIKASAAEKAGFSLNADLSFDGEAWTGVWDSDWNG